jgi:hypothetical protein
MATPLSSTSFVTCMSADRPFELLTQVRRPICPVASSVLRVASRAMCLAVHDASPSIAAEGGGSECLPVRSNQGDDRRGSGAAA